MESPTSQELFSILGKSSQPVGWPLEKDPRGMWAEPMDISKLEKMGPTGLSRGTSVRTRDAGGQPAARNPLNDKIL